ncbi:MAG: bifunctional DNA primase/polymerase [Kiritimatiellae bacterium]|nr:bifunctional DNA primase/polymerase [Kiritimatiellia bacterium]
MSNAIIHSASAYAHSGLSVIPTLADKRPACAWKLYTERIMSDREIEVHFRSAAGIGIACGKVSGNLELLDFDDGGSAFAPWLEKVPPYLKDRLVIECTPSGGRHVYYRVMGEGYSVPGNRKLAMKEDGHVLIETRGEGGYVKCSPSGGYELMQGDFQHIPTMNQFEEAILVNTAIALDEGPKPPKAVQASSPSATTPPMRVMPQTSAVDRAELERALTDAGWKKVRDGGEQHWERPGKDERATSATFNGDVFYVFSSNAAPFEPNRGYSVRSALRLLRPGWAASPVGTAPCAAAESLDVRGESAAPGAAVGEAVDVVDPGPLPEKLLSVPGFVDALAAHTLATAPYPNRPLAFAGALAMLSHLTGRNFRDERNLRTNVYLLALADSGVGKDYPRKVNMNLAAEVGIMPTMADRFASAEGLEDALLIHPASFFQVDEVDTLFAALQEKKDSAAEKIYGALLQFATSSDTTYAMRKKAIQQTGGKAGKFDKVRARGIREPHLTLLGCAIPKYLYSALSERAIENGLMSRCLVLEAGSRGKAGSPHFAPFGGEILETARYLVSLGGFDGIDLESLEEAPAPYAEPYMVGETPEAKAMREEVTEKCERLYDAAKDNAERALWSRGAEKTSRLALLYAISENVRDPLVTERAVGWAWSVVEHLTKRMLYQASVYVHDNEFDALRQKAIRQLRDHSGKMLHGALLRNMHVDADTLRRVVDTLIQSEIVVARQLDKGGLEYMLA